MTLIQTEEEKEMVTSFKSTLKIMSVVFAAVMMAAVVYAQADQGMKGDKTGEMRLKAGAERMISAEHLILSSLESQGLMNDPAITEGSSMLTAGERMILEGKKMMQTSETRIQGKEEMMQGSTKMMEGKDFVMKELRRKGLMKTKPLKGDEKLLADGENMMLSGKNLMMDGERNFV